MKELDEFKKAFIKHEEWKKKVEDEMAECTRNLQLRRNKDMPSWGEYAHALHFYECACYNLGKALVLNETN